MSIRDVYLEQLGLPGVIGMMMQSLMIRTMIMILVLSVSMVVYDEVAPKMNET